MEYYIAQLISILTALFAVLSMQMKKMKYVLITQILANLLAASTYLLLNGFSGAGISLIAILQLVVVYIYNVKKVEVHKPVIGIFIGLYAIFSIVNYKTIIDFFPFLAALCFALGISQKEAKSFRVFGIINPLCWLVYDIFTHAYVNVLIRVAIFISSLVAMIRLDGLLKKKNK